MEDGQKQLLNRTENIEKSQEILVTGQNEIRELIKHLDTLMSKNFTYLRKDIKTLALDVSSDFNLLIKELADIKGKLNKLEQK